MYVPLEGRITVRFNDSQGDHQIIDMQLPNFVQTNYFYSGKGIKYLLIDGPLVLRDKQNKLKSVVFSKGMVKQRNFCIVSLVPNTKPSKKEKKIQGLIYKYSEEAF